MMKKSIYESPELDIYLLTEDVMNSDEFIQPDETEPDELPVVPLPWES